MLKTKNNFFIILSVCLIAGAGVTAYFYFNSVFQKQAELRLRKIAWVKLEEKIRQEAAGFGYQSAVLIKDFATGWEIAVNENKLFPSASLVKLPIMASYMLAANQGKLNLEQSLVLKNSHKVLGSGILKDYASGTKFNLSELIRLMVAESDNTAANMLIDYLGFDALNSYFKKLGLNNTNIVRKMMSFKDRKEGRENFASAKDLASLLEKIYFYRLVNKDVSRQCLEILKEQKIRDRIPARLPAEINVAHKTGLEKGICHDAGIVFTSGGDFLVCVLTKHNYKVSRPAKKFISQIALDVFQYSQSYKSLNSV